MGTIVNLKKNKMKFIFGILSALIIFNVNASEIETIADSIVSVFENGTKEIQYRSITDIKDGRGYTAGKAGFTTATGDLLELIVRFNKTNPLLFRDLMKILTKRAKEESGDTSGLESLPSLWLKACDDPKFISAQDDLVDDWYKRPARQALVKYGLKSHLAYLIFYDTFIQHGDGEDPDSFSGVVSGMKKRPINEAMFLKYFLSSRMKILKNPSNRDSRSVWRESIDRVKALEKLLNQKQFTLTPPFKLEVWGEKFLF